MLLSDTTVRTNHATGSNFLLILYKIFDNDFLNLNPTAYSIKTNDMPKRNTEMMYGIINDPPPLEYSVFGNLQMLPNPTAEPIMAITSVKLLFHSLLLFLVIFYHLIIYFWVIL